MDIGPCLNAAIAASEALPQKPTKTVTVKYHKILKTTAGIVAVPIGTITYAQDFKPQASGKFGSVKEIDKGTFERACFEPEFAALLSDEQLVAACVKHVETSGGDLHAATKALIVLILNNHGVRVPDLNSVEMLVTLPPKDAV